MEQEKEMYEHAREIAANELENTKNEYSASEVRQLLMKMFPDAKTYADEKIKKELIEFLEMVAACGKNTDLDRWSKEDCAKWICWINKQHPMQHYISLEKKDFNSVIDCLLEHFKNSRESGEDETWFHWSGNNMLAEVIDYLEEIKRAEDKWSDTKPSEDAIDYHEIYMADYKRVFNVGDWIIDKQNGVYQIVKEDNGSFLLRKNTDSVVTTYLPIQVVEKNYRHWNIEYSKPGDILSVKFDNWEKIVLFIECTERGVTGYGISLKDGKLFDEDEKIIYSQTWPLVLKPATAEQREQLFKEFDAYGYKWNNNKKKMFLPGKHHRAKSDSELWGYEGH